MDDPLCALFQPPSWLTDSRLKICIGILWWGSDRILCCSNQSFGGDTAGVQTVTSHIMPQLCLCKSTPTLTWLAPHAQG